MLRYTYNTKYVDSISNQFWREYATQQETARLERLRPLVPGEDPRRELMERFCKKHRARQLAVLLDELEKEFA